MTHSLSCGSLNRLREFSIHNDYRGKTSDSGSCQVPGQGVHHPASPALKLVIMM